MSKISTILILSALLNIYSSSLASETVSSKIYVVDSIVVTEQRDETGLSRVPVSKDKFSKVLLGNGISLIRKGIFIAQDIYSEGFKRGDIEVVIDGEKYHSACPNRMDSPLTRINPLEMDRIYYSKENNSINTNLGGGLAIERIKPTNLTLIKSAYSQSLVSEESNDVAFSTMYNAFMLSGRYATGKGYENGDGNSFEELYGFSDNHTYKLGEISAVRTHGDFILRSAFTYSDNIMFPYLQMDERINRIYHGSVSYKKYKLYTNYTDHMMDNQLRISNMLMRTDVNNLTLGLVHDNFEILYRNWDSDNIIRTPMLTINNHLIPDVRYYSATYQQKHKLNDYNISYKIGFRQVHTTDAENVQFYNNLYSDASDDVRLYAFSINGYRMFSLKHNIAFKINAEISASEPTLEQLYISVRKPMGNPIWLGNPTLSQPVKYSLRPTLYTRYFNFSLYSHFVTDYITFANREVGTQKYKTYQNIDVLLTGFIWNLKYKNLQVTSGYTYAENQTSKKPVSEIAPFYLITSLSAPTYKNITVTVTHTFNDAQTRVNDEMDEYPTSSWHTFDLSLNYKYKEYLVALEIDNILDETYAQHLSYMRDPFGSGLPVTDPGMSIQLNILTNFEL